MNQKTTLSISTATILKIFGVAILLWFLWYIRDILILLFVVMILVAALSPLVEKLYRKRIPRFLSVILIYLLILFFFVFLIYLIIPPVALQVKELTHNISYYAEKITPVYQQAETSLPALQKSLESVASSLNKLTTNLWAAAVTIFGGLVSFVTVLVLTFYLLLERESIINVLVTFLPVAHKDKILSVFQKVGVKIGAWFRGQLILCLAIGVIDFIILTIFGIPYALVLGILAGILEVVPTIGPILSAVPPILLALAISPWTALFIALSYLGVQQLESQILVPKIMGKVVGVSPVIIILALLIGAKLLGIAGAILAVPIVATLQVVFTEWREVKN
jgi:predicted PurR-regulated permease PerM